MIGGTDPGETNLISGNISGISLGGYSTVWGNFIGTDFSGSAAIPNQTGISVQSASYILIGGTGIGQGNLISGNSNAGVILHDFATHVEIIRNKIGTDITGAGPLGNGRGIFIQGNDNFIGHIATGGGNIIAYNGDEGVLLAWSASHNLIEVNTIHDNGVGVYAMDDTTSANPFTQNLIYGNASLGLDLAPMGVNLNDPGDVDSGANQRLNYPEFTSTSTTVAEGSTCHGCTVEVFRSDTDPSNHGEGETLLGSVIAGPFGDFSLTYPSSLATCDRITATTTDVFGNTSEFSPNAAIGLCLTIDPSWFFLVEITIFIIIWFAVLVMRRRGGRPLGGAAAAGGAAGLVAALGTAGLMYALPNVELNFPLGGPPAQLPAVLPACERFLVPGSMIPFEGARGMPSDPLADDGEHGMPIDRGNDHDHTTPVDQLESYGFFWGPQIEPHEDDGEHGDGLVNPLADDGQHGNGLVNPLADDGEHGMPVDPYDHLTLSWDPFDHETMPIDPLDQEQMPVDPAKDDGEHGDGLVNPLADDGEHDDGLVMDDGEHGMPVDPYDQNAAILWQVELVGPTGVATSMVTTGNSIPLSAFLINGEKLKVDQQDYDSEPVAFYGVPGESTDFFGYEGVDGESQGQLMVNDQDFDREPLFWRLTGMETTGEGTLQPFCRSTSWLSFQLDSPRRLMALPWTDSAPPPPAPAPLPPAPTPVSTEEAPVGCVPTFTATMNLTCRFGPASAYKELGYLLQGESATVEGRNGDSTWWWIPNPDWQGYCWVWDGGGEAICIPEDLAQIAAPPLPTPTPKRLSCRSDLPQQECIAAEGTYSSGATTAPTCTCPG